MPRLATHSSPTFSSFVAATLKLSRASFLSVCRTEEADAAGLLAGMSQGTPGMTSSSNPDSLAQPAQQPQQGDVKPIINNQVIP